MGRDNLAERRRASTGVRVIGEVFSKIWERAGRSSLRMAVLRMSSGVFSPHHLLHSRPIRDLKLLIMFRLDYERQWR